MSTFLKGWRTHVLMGAWFVLGLLDQLKVLDMHWVLHNLGIPDDRHGIVMVAVALTGILMRQITTTPVGVTAPAPTPAAP